MVDDVIDIVEYRIAFSGSRLISESLHQTFDAFSASASGVYQKDAVWLSVTVQEEHAIDKAALQGDRYEIETLNGRSLLISVDQSKKRLTIFTPTIDEVVAREVCRCVRNAIEASLIVGGAVPIHASGVVLNGSAILFVGEKFSGKTTSMIRCLASGASFLCNDKAFIYTRGDRIWVRSLPVSCGIRSGTMSLFPQLKHMKEEPEVAHIENPDSFDVVRRGIKRLLCTPDYLVRAMHTNWNSSAPVRAIIFPSTLRGDDEYSISGFDTLSGIDRLIDNIIKDPFPHQVYWNGAVADHITKDRKPSRGSLHGPDFSQAFSQVLFATSRVGIRSQGIDNKQILDWIGSHRAVH